MCTKQWKLERSVGYGSKKFEFYLKIMIAYGLMSFPTVVQAYVINFLRVQSPLQLQV